MVEKILFELYKSEKCISDEYKRSKKSWDMRGTELSRKRRKVGALPLDHPSCWKLPLFCCPSVLRGEFSGSPKLFGCAYSVAKNFFTLPKSP